MIDALLLIKSAPGAIGLVANRLRDRRIKALGAMYEDLGRRLARLQERCDPETFDALVCRSVLHVSADTRDFKRRLFCAVLADAYAEDAKTYPGGLFVSLIERLDTHHVVLLRCLATTEGLDRGATDGLPAAIGFNYLLEEIVRAGLDGPTATDLTTGILNELLGSGLVHSRMRKDRQNSPMVGINPVGLVRNQVFLLSPLGMRFVRYLTEIDNADPA